MPEEVDPEELCFDHAADTTGTPTETVGPGDVETLDDRGVGFPEGDWDPEGNQNSPNSPIPEDQEP